MSASRNTVQSNKDPQPRQTQTRREFPKPLEIDALELGSLSTKRHAVRSAHKDPRPQIPKENPRRLPGPQGERVGGTPRFWATEEDSGSYRDESLVLPTGSRFQASAAAENVIFMKASSK